jgi:hypothetical protein
MESLESSKVRHWMDIISTLFVPFTNDWLDNTFEMDDLCIEVVKIHSIYKCSQNAQWMNNPRMKNYVTKIVYPIVDDIQRFPYDYDHIKHIL